MTRTLALFFVAFTIALTGCSSGGDATVASKYRIIAPSELVAGHSLEDWISGDYNWYMSFPVAHSPVVGAHGTAPMDTLQHDPVWYWAMPFGAVDTTGHVEDSNHVVENSLTIHPTSYLLLPL